MSNVQLELPGSDQAILRAQVESIAQQIALLPTHATVEAYRAAAAGLVVSWGQLAKLLALGDPARLRKCPRCERLGMRTATLCGYCWLKLSPLGPDGDGESESSKAHATADSERGDAALEQH